MTLRYLRSPGPEQLRLGWLRVIAAEVGAGQMSLPQLAQQLARHTQVAKQWATSLRNPLGLVQPSRADRLARMAVVYGIYREDTETLTDLGHVVRVGARWDRESSPFVLKGGSRWILFRVFMGAAGDAVQALLSGWPRIGATGENARKTLAAALSKLAERSSFDRAELRGYISRVASGKTDIGNKVLYPYLEPLVDLGYMRHIGAGGPSGYVLTDCGTRLAGGLDAIGGTADQWMRDGLARAFSEADAGTPAQPSHSAVLREILSDLPDELRVSRSEAPLEAVAILAQGKLTERQPGSFVDLRVAAERIRHIQKATEGRIFLKSGASVHELNVAWTSPDILSESDLWEEAPAAAMPEDAAGPSSHGVTVVHNGTEIHDGTEELPTSESDVSQPVVPVAPVPDSPGAPGERGGPKPGLQDPVVAGNVRIWLQYVDALVQPPRLGAEGLFPWGGWDAASGRLERLLEMSPGRLRDKRKPEADSRSAPARKEQGQSSSRPSGEEELRIRTVIRTLQSCRKHRRGRPEESAVAEHIEELWGNDSLSEEAFIAEARARLFRFRKGLDAASRAMAEEVYRFLAGSARDVDWATWDPVRHVTRMLVHDALWSGRWTSEALRSHVWAELARAESYTAAQAVLASLVSPVGSHDCVQQLWVDPRDLHDWGLPELNDNPDIPELRITLISGTPEADPHEPRAKYEIRWERVEARTADEAKRLSAARTKQLLRVRAREKGISGEQLRLIRHGTVDVIPALERAQSEPGAPDEAAARTAAALGLQVSVAPCASEIAQLSFKNLWQTASHGDPGGGRNDRRRLHRAQNGLLQAREIASNPGERLVAAWYAVEQLITGGDSNRSPVPTLSAAIALLHLRASIAGTLRGGVAALVQQALGQSGSDPLFQHALEWFPALERLQGIPPVIRRARADAEAGLHPPMADDKAMRAAIDRWKDIETLQKAIETDWPLAANRLYELRRMPLNHLPGKKDIGGDVPEGSEDFGKAYGELLEDIRSFLFLVYELRNRHVHEGEGFDAAQDPAVPEIGDRFLALAEPVVMAATQAVDEHHVGLDLFFAMFRTRSADLRSPKGLPLKQKLLDLALEL